MSLRLLSYVNQDIDDVLSRDTVEVTAGGSCGRYVCESRSACGAIHPGMSHSAGAYNPHWSGPEFSCRSSDSAT
jgi:hypothetical protein